MCFLGVWAILRADDISEDTMRSATVRIDGRASVGGRIIHGTQMISPVAENANVNAKLAFRPLLDGDQPIFAQQSAMGTLVVVPAQDGEETAVDLEMLFNATLQSPEVINQLFNTSK